MMKAKTLYLGMLAACGFLIGCSESQPDASKTSEADTPEPTVTTSGVVLIEDLPQEDITEKEVLVLSSLDSDARAHLERQRKLFEYTITGNNPELQDMDATLFAEDQARLTQAMADLKEAYPDQIIVNTSIQEPGVDDNRERRIPSDFELHEKYEKLFAAINWENLRRAIEFIDESINADAKKTAAKLDSSDAYTAKQAEVTMQWLLSLQAYLKDYLSMGNEYIDAQNRYSRETEVFEAKTWEQYLAMYSTQMIVDIFKHIEDSALVNDDGSFTVEGEGILIVRIEYGARSAYFMPEDPSETRVKITDLEIQK